MVRTKRNMIMAVFAMILVFACQPCRSQERQVLEAIAALTGAQDAESIDSEEAERLFWFLSHPLDLNNSPRSKLLSSGLLTAYQAASLYDYRSRCGDVLSIEELALVDGFGGGIALNLAPFVKLVSRALPGQSPPDTLSLRGSLLARASCKGDALAWGTKEKVQAGDLAELSLAARTTYSDEALFPPSSLSANLTVYGRRWLGKVIAGDFNARFGQGLVLWSGMSMSGFSGASSFSRRPTGISPSWSYSGTGGHRGVAADFHWRRFTASGMVSIPGLGKELSKPASLSVMPGANIAWHGPDGHLSLTGWWRSEPLWEYDSVGKASGRPGQGGGKISADTRWSWRGAVFFGEAAMDCKAGIPAFVLGASLPFIKDWTLSAVVRCYPDGFGSEYASGVRAWTKTADERGIALGLEKGKACLSADFAVKDADPSTRQLKVLAKVPVQVSSLAVLSLRLSERYRPMDKAKHRAGLRCDLDFSSAGIDARYGERDGDAWKGRARLEAMTCRSLAGLCYLEAGRKAENLSAYLRGTLFIVDNWDDRIYSYERDAPGNFTVPAYYGRGCSLSAVAGWKTRIRCGGRPLVLRLHGRASMTGYPFMNEPKPASSEAKFQIVLER